MASHTGKTATVAIHSHRYRQASARIVAAVAAFVPALRAASVNPMTALRAEG